MSEQTKGPRVYLASKLIHAPMWRDWRQSNSYGLRIVSTWHDNLNIDADDRDFDACRAGWTKNFADIDRADALIAFADRSEPINGTLVEIGAAISNRINVYLVGSFPWGTWQYSTNVYKCPSLADAAYAIKEDLS